MDKPNYHWLHNFPRYRFLEDGTPVWTDPPRRGRSAGKTEVRPFTFRGKEYYRLCHSAGKYCNIRRDHIAKAIRVMQLPVFEDLVPLLGIFHGYFADSQGRPYIELKSGAFRPVLSDLRWRTERYRLRARYGSRCDRVWLDRDQIRHLRSQNQFKI